MSELEKDLENDLRKDLDTILVSYYGTQIEGDLDLIKEKLDVIITAHLFAGMSGDNPLSIINREIKRITNSY